ncbi:MAG: apolipoprotein N-acyltransferase, partial [Phycisphaerales bacterium JB059]
AGVWGAPVLWGGIEGGRALVAFDGYPWFLVGHPLIDAPRWGSGVPSLAYPASLIGAMGVSALAAGVSGLVVDLWSRRPRRWVGVGLALLGVWIGLGAFVAPASGRAGSMRIGVVQTNVSQDNKIGWRPVDQLRDFQRFAELTVAAARQGPDLIVWPETMAPGQSLDPVSLRTEQAEELVWEIELEGEGIVELGTTELVEQLLSMQEMLGVPMLIGAEGYDNLRFVERADGKFVKDADAFYNSAYIVTGGRAQEPGYHKIKLTPFGEVMPYISLWPWLEAQVTAVGARGMSFDLSTAPRVVRPDTVLRDGSRVALATPICFEATMSGVCRRLVFERGERRAGVMINLTNDGWFGDAASGRRAHQLCARWRCVELGTSMVRVANTGISCVIDASGRVVREGVDPVPGESGEHATGGLERVDGVLVTDVALAAGVPVYARIGDLVAWGLIAGVGLCLVLALRGGSQSGEAGSAEDEGRTDAPARSNQ